MTEAAAIPAEWLDAPWQRLNQIRRQQRLPHALLIVGVDGIGKRMLARRLASALLCERPASDGTSCGVCTSCGWLHAGTHPDLLWAVPSEPGKAIKVDQIRALCSELSMTSHCARHKVAIVAPADAMNANAANSLLKTLEEPTDATLLILLSAVPGRLPATIRSRCQQLRLVAPPPVATQRWLESQGVAADSAAECVQMAGGAPLRAQALSQSESRLLRAQRLEDLGEVLLGHMDPLPLAARWANEHEIETLTWWLAWLRQLTVCLQSGAEPGCAGAVGKLKNVLKTVDCRKMYRIADGILRAQSSVGSGLNMQLLMEDLLIRWANLPNGDSRSDNG
jgi:DNA polymerase-3 subunit delta'